MGWLVGLAILGAIAWAWFATRDASGPAEAGAPTAQGSDGRPGATWSYSGWGFGVDVDFEAQTVDLRVSRVAYFHDKRVGGKPQLKRGESFRGRFPLLGFDCRWGQQDEDSEFVPNVATGWVGGAPVSVTLPGGRIHNRKNGRWAITFWSDEPGPLRLFHGQVMEGPKPGWASLDTFPMRASRVEKFLREWESVRARQKAISDKRRADFEAAAESDRAARMDAAARAAKARLGELTARAGVKCEFLAWSFDEARVAGPGGQIKWIVAADRDGRGLVAAGDEAWHGSFKGASAKPVSIAASPGAPAADGLEIEVRDAEFEAKHLARRRFKLMRGEAREKLLEWRDRINMLGGAG